MKAVRCPYCKLLVGPTNELGTLIVAAVANHEVRDGEAFLSELPVCPGSLMLGFVSEVPCEV